MEIAAFVEIPVMRSIVLMIGNQSARKAVKGL